MQEPSKGMNWADGQLVGMERKKGRWERVKAVLKVALFFVDEAIVLLVLAYLAYRLLI